MSMLNEIYKKQHLQQTGQDATSKKRKREKDIQELINDFKRIHESREKHCQSLWSSGRIKYDQCKREDTSIRLTQKRFDLLFHIVKKQQQIIQELIKKNT